MEENTGISHWEKYQGNLDEKCDGQNLKDFTIRPWRVALVIAAIFSGLILCLICAYSKITVSETDERILVMSIPGSILFFIVCWISGYLLAKEMKNRTHSFATMAILTVFISIIGTYLPPIIFNASYDVFSWGVGQYSPPAHYSRYYLYACLNIFLILLLSTAGILTSSARYHQE